MGWMSMMSNKTIGDVIDGAIEEDTLRSLGQHSHVCSHNSDDVPLMWWKITMSFLRMPYGTIDKRQRRGLIRPL
jgi:hypothetical protein